MKKPNKKQVKGLILIAIFGFCSISFCLFWIDNMIIEAPEVITIEGATPYELGYNYGVKCRAEIQGPIEFIRIASLLNVFNLGVNRLHADCDDFIPTYLKQEMQGVADGAGVTYDEIFMLNCLGELERWAVSEVYFLNMFCSMMVYNNSWNTNLGPMQARTMDFNFDTIMGNWQILLRIKPPNGNDVILTTWAGMVGGLAGLNNESVSVSVSLTNPLETGPGIPIILQIRDALHHANSTADAAAIMNGTYTFTDDRVIKNHRGTSGWNLMTLDENGTAAVVEISNARNNTRYMGDVANGESQHYIAVTNHFISDAMKNYSSTGSGSANRFYTLNTTFKSAAAAQQAYTPYDMALVLRSRIDPRVGADIQSGSTITMDEFPVYLEPCGTATGFISVNKQGYVIVCFGKPRTTYFFAVTFDEADGVIGPLF